MSFRAFSLLALGALAAVPATAQALRVEVFSTRRPIISSIWGSGNWIVFTQEEEDKDLNGDGDTDDTVVCLADQRNVSVQVTPLAADYAITDSPEDWPAAVSGDTIAILASEADSGGRDLNGNGKATDNVFVLYNAVTRKYASLGVGGRQPVFHGGKLYFTREEREAGADLNGDGDQNDTVLCVADPATLKVQSLGMDAGGGFKAAGDWIAALTSELSQGAKDLNGDRDTGDQVVQIYRISQGKWTNTGLDGAASFALTTRLLAVGVQETRQGNQDLNGDRDAQDTVCFVWDLAAGTAFNTRQDCSGGLAADGSIAAMGTGEKNQGDRDLNGDRDTNDTVVQVYTLGAQRVLNLARDGSGGLAAGAGRIAFGMGETEQGNRDLNGDRDTEDTVMQLYDPVKNTVANTGISVSGDLYTNENILAWTMSESDQGNRDFNRDRDADDDILCILDFKTGASTITASACSDHVRPTARGVGFGMFEADQGDRDLNGNGDTNDEILQVARLAGR